MSHHSPLAGFLLFDAMIFLFGCFWTDNVWPPKYMAIMRYCFAALLVIAAVVCEVLP